MSVRVEELAEAGGVALADLAQHPADRFVNEVVRVVQQTPGDPHRVVELVAADEVERGDDRDPSLPQVLRAREAVEPRPAALEKPCADDVLGRHVDEVPVVDPAGVVEVEVEDPPSRRLVAAAERVDQNEQSDEPDLVLGRVKQRGGGVNRERAVSAGDRAQFRDAQAEEDVALAVFARAALEESLREGGSFGIATREHRVADFARSGCACHSCIVVQIKGTPIAFSTRT